MLKSFLNTNLLSQPKQYKPGRCHTKNDFLKSKIYKDLYKCDLNCHEHTPDSRVLNKEYKSNIFEIFAVNYYEKY